MGKWMILALSIATQASAQEGVSRHTEWVTKQTIDPMSDVRKCVVRAKDEDITPIFALRSDRDWFFVVSNADFPGRNVRARARVDKNLALTGEEDLSPSQDKQLFKQIREGGTKLLTESYQWPHDYQVVREFALGVLVPKLDDCERWVRTDEPPAATH